MNALNVKEMILSDKFLFYFTLIGILIIYMIGMNIELVETDSALYAEIAREMAVNNNYWEIYLRGEDWLDKPHMLFWLSALSFEIFGISHFTYKLPSIIIFLIGLRYIWLLARHDYGERTAALAVIILAVSQHIMSSNSDVRTDALLLGFIVMAAYHCRRLIDNNQLIHILAGAFALAAALMTKGIFIAIVPAGGVIAYALYKRKYSIIFSVRWFVLAGLCLLFISPMLIAYYFQFDAQPHKQYKILDWGVVSNISAIKFYFWDSQVGRIADTGLVYREGKYSFFLATILWAFMPWGVLWYAFLFAQARKIFLRQDAAVFYLGCSLPLLIIYSLASNQLPHYINILLPFFAIGVAHFLVTLKSSKIGKVLSVIQCLQIALILFVAIYIFVIFRPRLDVTMIDVAVVWLVGAAMILLLFIANKNRVQQIVFAGAMAMIMFNYFANRIFLPQLLEYQCTAQIAHHLNKNQLADAPLYTYDMESMIYELDFYMNKIVPVKQPTDEIIESQFYLITQDNGLQNFQDNGYKTDIVLVRPDFSVSKPTPEFINYKTRDSVVTQCYLVLVSSE